MERRKSEHGKKWMYWLTLGGVLIVIFHLLNNFTSIGDAVNNFLDVSTPFLMGTFIAYVLYVPSRAVEKKLEKTKSKFIQKRARGLSILITYLLAIASIALLINFIFPIVVESAIDLVDNLQSYLSDEKIEYNEIIKNIMETIQGIDIREELDLEGILAYLGSAVSVVTSIFEMFVTGIVSIYVLMDRRKIVNFIKRAIKVIFKKEVSSAIEKYFQQGNETFSKFLGAQFIDAILVGAMTTIAMSIMGVKYAPVLGFLIGISNMIPYIGAIVAVGIATIITAITGGITQMIWMLVVVLILQQIDANILNPKIIGQSLEISPLVIIFGVTVAGAYFGIIGMFLAAPVAAVLKVIIMEYIEQKEKEAQVEENSMYDISI